MASLCHNNPLTHCIAIRSVHARLLRLSHPRLQHDCSSCSLQLRLPTSRHHSSQYSSHRLLVFHRPPVTANQLSRPLLAATRMVVRATHVSVRACPLYTTRRGGSDRTKNHIPHTTFTPIPIPLPFSPASPTGRPLPPHRFCITYQNSSGCALIIKFTPPSIQVQ